MEVLPGLHVSPDKNTPLQMQPERIRAHYSTDLIADALGHSTSAGTLRGNIADLTELGQIYGLVINVGLSLPSIWLVSQYTVGSALHKLEYTVMPQ